MKKLFWNLFIQIFLIAIAVLALQSCVFFFQYRYSMKNWQKSAFFNFEESVKKAFENKDYDYVIMPDFGRILENEKDKRISGCLVRNASTGFLLASYGQIPPNKAFSDPKPSVLHPHYVSRIRLLNNNGKIAVLKEILNPKKYNANLPSSVRPSEIIGTIVLASDNADLFNIDLLGFTPRNFEYSKDVINPLIKSFFILIPLSLIIAGISAFVISKKNAKTIADIRGCLKKLEEGERNIEVSHSKMSFLDDIYIAIEELDKALTKAEKSKTLWLNGLSHELNTPATGIKIMIEGINNGAFPKTKKNLSAIESECDILIAKIKTIMEIWSSDANINSALEVENPSNLFKASES